VTRWLSFRVSGLSPTRIWVPILASAFVVFGAASLLATDLHWMRREFNARGINE
jgi:hypothetical protein